MADSTRFSDVNPDLAEADELRQLAERLAQHNDWISGGIGRLLGVFDASLAAARHPVEAEQAAETFTRRLRRLWLETAAHEASSVFRSPTEGETRRLAKTHDAFGYERDLQPETLEARARDFFPAPPAGWGQAHLIFSSGQAAMTSALIGLGARLSPGQPLRLAHRGAYFETRSLIKLLSFIAEATFAQTADVVLDEPICCDGQFHQIDTAKLLALDAPPRAVIFDTTLLGRDDGIDRYLAALNPGAQQVVLRVTSCLKLFESGFELANAGILSIYASQHETAEIADSLRRIRTLTGAGLNLVDAIALEAPWFLDADHADRYTAAIFASNAALAHAVAQSNQRFAPVSHPSLTGGNAPYCVFQLAGANSAAYDTLENEITGEARQRRLLLAHGGSFGFRGHRFEVVRPDTGEPPFLRIAMGRRSGWSRDGVITMMSEIAAR